MTLIISCYNYWDLGNFNNLGSLINCPINNKNNTSALTLWGNLWVCNRTCDRKWYSNWVPKTMLHSHPFSPRDLIVLSQTCCQLYALCNFDRCFESLHSRPSEYTWQWEVAQCLHLFVLSSCYFDTHISALSSLVDFGYRVGHTHIHSFIILL